jgi:uncharacterized membrane protein YhfC
MFGYDVFIILVGILIALVPVFVLFLYIAQRRTSLWFVFGIGVAGWIIAIVRIPILQWLGNAFLANWVRSAGTVVASYISLGINALFAGLFEEGIRYGLAKKIKRTRADLRHVLSFGLGWGFGEAVLIYVYPIVAAYLQGRSIPVSSLLLGALERNIAIALHVGFAFLIFRAATQLRFLWVAIIAHFLVDFIGVSLYTLTGNVGVTYVVASAFALVLIGYLCMSRSARSSYPWWQIRPVYEMSSMRANLPCPHCGAVNDVRDKYCRICGRATHR